MVESKSAQTKLNFSFKESTLKKRLHSETANPEQKIEAATVQQPRAD